jgi:hypothetical protein
LARQIRDGGLPGSAHNAPSLGWALAARATSPKYVLEILRKNAFDSAIATRNAEHSRKGGTLQIAENAHRTVIPRAILARGICFFALFSAKSRSLAARRDDNYFTFSAGS